MGCRENRTWEVGLWTDVGASMWRAEGVLAKFLTRPKRVGEGLGVELRNERLWVLGNWEDWEEEREQKAKAAGRAETAMAVDVVATDLRNAILFFYANRH